jgi:hypothetical protein
MPRRRAHSATRTPPRLLPDRAMRALSRTRGRPATPIPRRAEDPAAASTARARPRAPDAVRCPLPHRATPPCRATPSEPPRPTASRTVHPSTEDLATKIPRRPFITRVKKLQWNRFSFPHSPPLLPPSMNAINGRSLFSSLPRRSLPINWTATPFLSPCLSSLSHSLLSVLSPSSFVVVKFVTGLSTQHLIGAPSDVKNPCPHALQHHC